MSTQFDAGTDLYERLGVSPDASDDEIKRAYRRLAKKYHPDVNREAGAESKFKDITAAYDVLGDKQKRSTYDAMRSGMPFGDGVRVQGGGGGGVFDLGDLFAQMFGGARSAGGPGGADVRWSFFGQEPPNGAGDVFTDGSRIPFGNARVRRRRGRVATEVRERKLRAADGSTLIQRGDDLYSEVRLKLDEAILGCAKQIPTLSGTATVKIPPGTGSGVKLRLKGKGVPISGGLRGDHFVTVQIDVPKRLTSKARRLLATLMHELGDNHGDRK